MGLTHILRSSRWRREMVALSEASLQYVLRKPRCIPFGTLKRTMLRLYGAEIGRRVVIYQDVFVFPGRGLILKDDVDIARGATLTTRGGVVIGARTLVGYGVYILSSNHRIPERNGRIFDSGHEHAPVVIGDDCWIGANSVILPGVSIGEGSIVAAGAVVTKSQPAFSIIAGVPAKAIRERS